MNILKSLSIICWLLLAGSPAMAWTVISEPDSRSVGSTCPKFGTTQMKVSSDRSLTGTRSCINTIQGGTSGFGKWGGIMGWPSKLYRGDELWVRVTVFWPAGFNYDSTSGGNKLKFLRVKTFDAGGKSQGYNDLYINPEGFVGDHPFQFIYEGQQKWAKVGTPKHAIVRGRWETYEMYLKLDSKPQASGGMARVRVWKDGELMADVRDRQTLNGSNHYANTFYLFTYWNGKAPKTQSMYVDEVVVTSDRPSNTDVNGFPYLGMKGVENTGPARPKPPSQVGAGR